MIDLKRPVQTNDGRPVRILCTDRQSEKNDYRVVALIPDCLGNERIHFFRLDGTTPGNVFRLINVPDKREVWVNVYKERRHDCFHESKEDADQAQSPCPDNGRIACIKLTYEAPI